MEREGALPLAVLRSIAFGGDDPVLPARVAETDTQLVLLTHLPLVAAAAFCHVGHLSVSWLSGVLQGFWLRCLPAVDPTLRRWPSVALKNAPRKGSLLCGPSRLTRPPAWG